MNGIDVSLAFSAGLLATFNPCGWAMLPSFLSFYLGADQTGYEQKPLRTRVMQGVLLGVLVTLGFLIVFVVIGTILSAGLRYLSRYLPLFTILVGVLMVGLGVWLLLGKSVHLSLPAFQNAQKARNPKAAFLFGVGYGMASLGCTLPAFLIVVATTLRSDGIASGLTMLLAFGLGIALVVMGVTLSASLLQGAITQWFKRFLPYVYRVSAILLIIAGVYIALTQVRSLPLVFGG